MNNTSVEQKKMRILVVDDHTLFRKGIIGLLEKQDDMEVVGEAINGVDGVEKAKELKPDVVLMDLMMPKMNGIKAAKAIKKEMSDIDIIMLTVSEDDENLFEAVKAGAKGYILKNVEPEQLVKSIGFLFKGEAVISRTMATKIISEFTQMAKKIGPQTTEKTEELSPREKEILQHLSQGSTNKEIANTLYIAENTVKLHIRHILRKLHLKTRVQAALYTLTEGISFDDEK
ncbi:MAG: response regulator [Nitrospirota bacterium]